MNFKVTIIEDNGRDMRMLVDAVLLWNEQVNATLEIEEYNNAEKYFASHSTDDSDLFILDIVMPHLDGIGATMQLRERGYSGVIFFASLHKSFALDAFDVNASRYLVKPVSQEIMSEALSEVYRQLQDTHFQFRDSVRIIKIPYRDILCFSVQKHYVDIITDKGEYSIRSSLKNILPSLPDNFVQCQRSCVVNTQHIHQLTMNNVTLSNSTTIRIGRNYLDALRDKFEAI